MASAESRLQSALAGQRPVVADAMDLYRDLHEPELSGAELRNGRAVRRLVRARRLRGAHADRRPWRRRRARQRAGTTRERCARSSTACRSPRRPTCRTAAAPPPSTRRATTCRSCTPAGMTSTWRPWPARRGCSPRPAGMGRAPAGRGSAGRGDAGRRARHARRRVVRALRHAGCRARAAHRPAAGRDGRARRRAGHGLLGHDRGGRPRRRRTCGDGPARSIPSSLPPRSCCSCRRSPREVPPGDGDAARRVGARGRAATSCRNGQGSS